ncbi:LLM class flavin-dependent oxidoreductase [Streptomyces sp. NPDC059697]|uniref:LLM class flavin-dependent oxidoreductase n=1 Tax=Streptomyces sp. NPDC059697 TaxID=3346912 RepID=UPI0036B4B982
MRDLAVLAEELGYSRVWIYDSAPLREAPFAHLALAARRTTRIGLSTAVLIPGQRSVMTMASGIATVARELRAFATTHRQRPVADH